MEQPGQNASAESRKAGCLARFSRGTVFWLLLPHYTNCIGSGKIKAEVWGNEISNIVKSHVKT